MTRTRPTTTKHTQARRLQDAVATPSGTRLLRDQQVMQRLGISRTGLHHLMRKQGLPYIKLGSGRRAALRFSEASITQWLKQQERHAPTS